MNKQDVIHRLEQEAKRVALEMANFREAYSFREDKGHAFPAKLKKEGSGPRGNKPSDPPLKTDQQSPSSGLLGFSPLYYYPFLFSDVFPGLSLETLRTMALANRVLLEGILVLDRHMDSAAEWTPDTLCLVDACYHRAMDLFVPLFPSDHFLWEKTETYFLEYARSVMHERTYHRYRLSPYDDNEFIEISTGKVALLKTTVLAMCLLSDTQHLFTPLTESQRWFLVGFQAFDDLKDWKEDLSNHNFTQLLTEAVFLGGFEPSVQAARLPTPKALGQVIYYQGLAEDQLLSAEEFFEKAIGHLDGIEVPTWREIIHGFLTNCRAMRADLGEIRRRTLARHQEARSATLQKENRDEPPHECEQLPRGSRSTGGKEQRRNPSARDSKSRVILHPGFPATVARVAEETLERCRELLPSLPPGDIYLGEWSCMPAHFLVPQDGHLHAGIHLLQEGLPSPRSIGNRPMEVEMVLALSTAVRYSLRGPFRDRLERIYVSGLGLQLCEILFPERPFSDLAGMPELHLRWCRTNEGYLWDQIKLFLHRPSRNRSSHRWLLPDRDPPTRSPIPRGAALYMGRTLFHPPQTEQNLLEQVPGLLDQDRRDILRTFRIKAGLEPERKSHAG